MKKLGIILLIAACSQCYAQQYRKYIRKAERAVSHVNYPKALENYDKALAQNENGYEANAGKGMLLGELMEKYEQAVPYLEKALDKSSKDTLLTIYYTLGKCYHYLGDYNRALFCYNKLNAYEEIGNPMFSLELNKNIADCNYALEHLSSAPNTKVLVSNAGNTINSTDPEYAPVLLSPNELLFTSKRKDNSKEKVNKWDGKYFESMYLSRIDNGKLTAPVRYTRPDLQKNSKFLKYNESSVSVSPDGRSMFIYRGGDIFIVPVKDHGKKPEKLDKKINHSKYQNHAAISKDNNTIYFSSEAAYGYGGTDIFMSQRNSNGEWTEARLLDSTINTVFNEDAPFITEDGTLYFASEGHPGFGGYDIYKSRQENGKWTKPVNLGQPINSPGEDIFLTLLTENEGYYSSARPGGSGDLDIYQISLDPGLKKDSVADPLLAIKDPKELEKPLKSAGTDPKKPETGTKNKYLNESELKAMGWNNAPLYFNYNEYSLNEEAMAVLNKNLEVLRKNSNIKIDINGYSDARGEERYNIYLSGNRAAAVKQYILNKGIDRARIRNTEGKGEKDLVNNCGDGTECTEEQHKENRRVQVQVLNPNYKPEGMVSTDAR
ncbi:MAG TPA: OmpA family protein [Bacteroidia bacterium]